MAVALTVNLERDGEFFGDHLLARVVGRTRLSRGVEICSDRETANKSADYRLALGLCSATPYYRSFLSINRVVALPGGVVVTVDARHCHSDCLATMATLDWQKR